MDIDVAIASVVSLLSFGGLYKLTSNLGKEKGTLREYQNSRVYFPSALHKKFSDKEFYKNLPQSHDNSKEYRLKGFVEGYVNCNNPIKSKLDGKTDLVYSKVTRKEIRSNDFLASTDNDRDFYSRKSNISAPLYFSLKDPENKQNCLVHKNFDVKTLGALEKIAEIDTLKELNPLEEVFIQIGKVVGILAAFSKNLLFRGFHIGYNEVERGITVGSPLTVYGEIVYNLTEKTMKIETPLAFLKDKTSLITKIKESISEYYAAIIFVSIPFLLSTGYLVAKGYRYWKRKYGGNQQLPPPNPV